MASRRGPLTSQVSGGKPGQLWRMQVGAGVGQKRRAQAAIGLCPPGPAPRRLLCLAPRFTQHPGLLQVVLASLPVISGGFPLKLATRVSLPVPAPSPHPALPAQFPYVCVSSTRFPGVFYVTVLNGCQVPRPASGSGRL